MKKLTVLIILSIIAYVIAFTVAFTTVSNMKWDIKEEAIIQKEVEK